jgi:two-component system, chemotaxis family, CheB/CheR fusion protein
MLHLSEAATEHGIRTAIGFFSRSLAEDRKERAIFILFLGADSDGTLGIRAVRDAGGLTIAQDQTAQFGQMPQSAVATGHVDLVLPPEQMPKAIMDYLSRSYVRETESRDSLQAEEKPGGLDVILETLQAQIGHDFATSQGLSSGGLSAGWG